MRTVDSSVVSRAEVAFQVIFDGAPRSVVARVDAVGAAMHSAAQAEAEEEEEEGNDGTGEATTGAATTSPLPPLLSYTALDNAEKDDEEEAFDMYLRDFAGQCKRIAVESAFFPSACRVAEQPQTTTTGKEEEEEEGGGT